MLSGSPFYNVSQGSLNTFYIFVRIKKKKKRDGFQQKLSKSKKDKLEPYIKEALSTTTRNSSGSGGKAVSTHQRVVIDNICKHKLKRSHVFTTRCQEQTF